MPTFRRSDTNLVRALLAELRTSLRLSEGLDALGCPDDGTSSRIREQIAALRGR